MKISRCGPREMNMAPIISNTTLEETSACQKEILSGKQSSTKCQRKRVEQHQPALFPINETAIIMMQDTTERVELFCKSTKYDLRGTKNAIINYANCLIVSKLQQFASFDSDDSKSEWKMFVPKHLNITEKPSYKEIRTLRKLIFSEISEIDNDEKIPIKGILAATIFILVCGIILAAISIKRMMREQKPKLSKKDHKIGSWAAEIKLNNETQF